MNKIEGVEIQVLVGEVEPMELTVAEDGYLGRLKSGALTLVAKVAHGLPIYGIGVDGKKNVSLLRDRNKMADLSPLLPLLPSPKAFTTRIVVEYGEGVDFNGGQEAKYREVFFTRYPANNLRLLRLEPTGKFSIWEVAIVSQESEFYLTVQETYSGSCYRSEDGLACPKLNNWPQMIQLFADIIGEAGLANLPDTISYSEDTKPPARFLETPDGKPTGIVLWWNLAMGLGVINTEKGQARVHWTQAPKRDRLAFLAKDETVTFEELVTPKANPKRPTTFQLEAKGVTLVS